MKQPLTPIEALQLWLAAQSPGAALAAVPVAVLLEHFLQARAQGLPSAGHELQVLGVLVDHWLKRMRSDIDSFPLEAVPVLQEQKKSLQAMHFALTELQSCLQSLQPSQAHPLPGAKRVRQRPASWQARAPILQAKPQQV
ncbi:hypothetical protein [Roseateles oligotrophus]|uniref:Uncharacterized protein n=1 Tax=Roseateles oligotrophus TaxID=1769250 RepID=A0ABT2YB77_9BURK|nr:hypothetical protein [Roseateles oligotrophus]MCV2367551.1 hypothetical protein [Roseateles oligotrophus]